MKKWIAPLACLVVCSAAVSAFGDYYLYVPHEVKKAKIPAGESGVLVKEIVIRRGETLSGLSHKYSGRSSWYPQILLFNKIRNPNLIYAGHTIRIPVRKEGTTGRFAETERTFEPAPLPRSEATAPSSPSIAEKKAPPTEQKSGEQRLYDSAMSLFNSGKYQQALTAFDRFLARYPDSPLAAEISLRRAETYLRLSAE